MNHRRGDDENGSHEKHHDPTQYKTQNMFPGRFKPSQSKRNASRNSHQHHHARDRERTDTPIATENTSSPQPCRRCHPCRMWHSLASTLSNNMNRITLLMYVMMTANTNPVTTSTAIKPA